MQLLQLPQEGQGLGAGDVPAQAGLGSSACQGPVLLSKLCTAVHPAGPGPLYQPSTELVGQALAGFPAMEASMQCGSSRSCTLCQTATTFWKSCWV